MMIPTGCRRVMAVTNREVISARCTAAKAVSSAREIPAQSARTPESAWA